MEARDPALGAERDVRSPLARRRDAADRADDMVVRDDDPQVEAERRHELLHERPVGVIPGLVAATRASSAASAASSSHRSTPSPQLPKRGLTTTGGERREAGRRRSAACAGGAGPRGGAGAR